MNECRQVLLAFKACALIKVERKEEKENGSAHV